MKVILKKPVALPDHKVYVLNYNRRPNMWETGVVYNTESDINSQGVVSYKYRVRLDRRSHKGNLLFLHVGDEGIKSLESPENDYLDRKYEDVFGQMDSIGMVSQNSYIVLDTMSNASLNELETLLGRTVTGFRSNSYELVIFFEDGLYLKLRGGAIGGEHFLDVDADIIENLDPF